MIFQTHFAGEVTKAEVASAFCLFPGFIKHHLICYLSPKQFQMLIEVLKLLLSSVPSTLWSFFSTKG